MAIDKKTGSTASDLNLDYEFFKKRICSFIDDALKYENFELLIGLENSVRFKTCKTSFFNCLSAEQDRTQFLADQLQKIDAATLNRDWNEFKTTQNFDVSTTSLPNRSIWEEMHPIDKALFSKAFYAEIFPDHFRRKQYNQENSNAKKIIRQQFADAIGFNKQTQKRDLYDPLDL